jgi:hypothetical protein
MSLPEYREQKLVRKFSAVGDRLELVARPALRSVRPNARENGRIRPSTKRSDYPRCW